MLNYLGFFPLQTRQVNFVRYLEKDNRIITAGIDGVFMYDFKARITHRSNPIQGLQLDPVGEQFQAELGPLRCFEKMPLWVKGITVIEKESLIFTWSQLEATFHDTEGKLIYKYKALSAFEDYITDVIIKMDSKVFITSTLSGQISAWKFQKEKELLHQFTGHTNKVTSMRSFPGRADLFISASNDNSIRIHSLDKLQTMYTFNLQSGVSFVKLLSENVFAACYEATELQIGHLMHLALPYKNSQNEVVELKKAFHTAEGKRTGKASMIMTLNGDNSIEVKTASSQPKLITIIYPPPTATDITYMHYCMNLDRILVQLRSGALCKYKFDPTGQDTTACLESYQEFKQIKDQNKRTLTQEITCITVCQTIPPQYDEEIIDPNAMSNERVQEDLLIQKSKWPEHHIDRFIAYGLSKGGVVFCPVDKTDQIYTRISVHQDAVLQLCEVPKHEAFVSICEAHTIYVWKFHLDTRQRQILQVVRQSKMYRPVSHVQVVDSALLIGFQDSDLQLFNISAISQNKLDLIWLYTSDSSEHEGGINGVDNLPSQKLTMSCGPFGFVKIWNQKKELIREITFGEAIASAQFLNEEGDILIAHGNKVSFISHESKGGYGLPKLNQERADLEFSQYLMQNYKLATSSLFLELMKKEHKIRNQKKNFKSSKKVTPSNLSPRENQGSQEAVKEPEKNDELHASIVKSQFKNLTSVLKLMPMHEPEGQDQQKAPSPDKSARKETPKSSSQIQGKQSDILVVDELQEDTESKPQSPVNLQKQVSVKKQLSIKKQPTLRGLSLGENKDSDGKPSTANILKLKKQETEEKEPPEVDIEALRAKVCVNSVPLDLVELNYAKAKNRLLRNASLQIIQTSKGKNSKKVMFKGVKKVSTRRDITIQKIQDNIEKYNSVTRPQMQETRLNKMIENVYGGQENFQPSSTAIFSQRMQGKNFVKGKSVQCFPKILESKVGRKDVMIERLSDGGVSLDLGMPGLAQDNTGNTNSQEYPSKEQTMELQGKFQHQVVAQENQVKTRPGTQLASHFEPSSSTSRYNQFPKPVGQTNKGPLSKSYALMQGQQQKRYSQMHVAKRNLLSQNQKHRYGKEAIAENDYTQNQESSVVMHTATSRSQSRLSLQSRKIDSAQDGEPYQQNMRLPTAGQFTTFMKEQSVNGSKSSERLITEPYNPPQFKPSVNPINISSQKSKDKILIKPMSKILVANSSSVTKDSIREFHDISKLSGTYDVSMNSNTVEAPAPDIQAIDYPSIKQNQSNPVLNKVVLAKKNFINKNALLMQNYTNAPIKNEKILQSYTNFYQNVLNDGPTNILTHNQRTQIGYIRHSTKSLTNRLPNNISTSTNAYKDVPESGLDITTDISYQPKSGLRGSNLSSSNRQQSKGMTKTKSEVNVPAYQQFSSQKVNQNGLSLSSKKMVINKNSINTVELNQYDQPSQQNIQILQYKIPVSQRKEVNQ